MHLCLYVYSAEGLHLQRHLVLQPNLSLQRRLSLELGSKTSKTAKSFNYYCAAVESLENSYCFSPSLNSPIELLLAKTYHHSKRAAMSLSVIGYSISSHTYSTLACVHMWIQKKSRGTYTCIQKPFVWDWACTNQKFLGWDFWVCVPASSPYSYLFPHIQ